MTKIALDTALLVALVDSKDKWHPQAMAIKEALQAADAELIFLDPVVGEVITGLGRR